MLVKGEDRALATDERNRRENGMYEKCGELNEDEMKWETSVN